LSYNNLLEEKVFGKCYVTGNTVLDNLLAYKNRRAYGDKVLVTMHRRENHYWMDDWFKEINRIASDNPDLEFILPIHPNPEVQKHKHLLTKVKVIEPLNHQELLDILVTVKLVITDSGGLQEEGSFFNKKIIVCRKTTERPEAIETGHLHLCKSPQHLNDLFKTLIKDYYINVECPYGNGNASQTILDIIKNN
jgi:UDP-N-acetylglucosamine 2-epimerase (non-hydrolysing)